MIVIEHNLDVIKTADYMIDIGPEGGDKGGTVVASRYPGRSGGKSCILTRENTSKPMLLNS
ncbi:MAG: hypothetical protein ACLR2O_17210 [Coprococcus sp.]